MVVKKVARRKPVKRVSKKRTPAKRRTAAKAPARKQAATHKQALFDAKSESQKISHYLRALENRKKGRGPRKNPDVLERRIASLQVYVKEATGLRRLQAVQRIRNMQREQSELADAGNFGKFEADFIASAKSYSEKNGIDYGSWREVGVDAAVLKKAGIAVARERL